MIDRRLFYSRIRSALFGGTLQQSQVNGIEAILNCWQRHYPNGDPRWLAYILGTAHHETDRTMQPIEEYDKGGNRLYGRADGETGCTYYGRGFVQLTWKENYEKVGNILDMDLVRHPEIASKLEPAAEIIVKGMVNGWFTGARLSWYFNGEKEDWYNARRIVNGLDRANLVAGYAKTYYQAGTEAPSMFI